MKRIIGLCLAVMLWTGIAQAQPFIACDPQSDADGYAYSLDGGAWIDVPYTTFVSTVDGKTYAKIVDVGNVATGNHNIQVKAFKVAEWGRLESAVVPFDFVRPTLGQPQTIRLRK